MRQSTSALRDYLDGKNGNRQIKVKLVYPGGDEIRSVQTLDYDCSFGNSLALGNTVSANIRVTCETPAFDVSEREFTLFFGVMLPGDTDETWTQIGIFKTIPKSTESRMGFTTFTAYDRMYINTNKQYNAKCDFPCSLQDILNDVCGQAGFNPVPAITANPTVDGDVFSEYTLRDVIGYIASYQGKNAYVDCEGKLTLKWFTTCNYTADSKKANIPFADEKDTTIQLLVCSTGDDDIEVGTGKADTQLLSFNNPIMTEERLEEIKDAIAGFTYRRLDAEIPLGSYLIESGDIISIKYENEAFNFEYAVPAMTVSYHYDGGLSCKVSSYGVPDGVMKSLSAKKFRDHTKFGGLKQEILNATEAITGANGGFIRIMYGDDGKTAEIVIADNQDIEDKATQVWRWNKAGLGHSSHGYNGPYDDVAITADGKIMAEFIAGSEIHGVNFRTLSENSQLLLKEGQINFLKGKKPEEQYLDDRFGALSAMKDADGRDSMIFWVMPGSSVSFAKERPGREGLVEVQYVPNASEPIQSIVGMKLVDNDVDKKQMTPALVIPDYTAAMTGERHKYFNVGAEIHDLHEKIKGLQQDIQYIASLFRLVTKEE